MNAATVKGPSSWIRALIFLDGDENFTFAAPDQNLRDVARGDLLQLAARFGGVRHRLAVDRQNQVELAKGCGRRPIRVHVADQRAGPARRGLPPPRDLWREVLQREAEARAALFGGVIVLGAVGAAPRRALLGLEIELLDGDVDRL